MKRVAVLCTVFDIILFVAGEKKNKPVLSLSLLKQRVPAEKLHCYHCVQNNYGCLNLVNISQVPIKFCNLDQPHCIVVKRLETGGKLTEFSRNCAEECTPGCEWGVTYIRCTSCCNTSRCNVDSHASRNHPTVSIPTTAITTTTAAATFVGRVLWLLSWLACVRVLTRLTT